MYPQIIGRAKYRDFFLSDVTLKMKIKYLKYRMCPECELVAKDEGWKCREGSDYKGSHMVC